MSATTGLSNPNWRGGKSIASNGYILLRVGIDHHLADVRGYAYEHRVIAEQKLGRRLKRGELIHHANGDKKDNRPKNIIIVPSIAHHFLQHRNINSNLRKPDEKNIKILCLCGCKKRFLKYDSYGRPRRYIPGHNVGDKKGLHHVRRYSIRPMVG